ncbi:uncharacterized protein LOC111201375 [Brassica napus]|uniref:uncharacterized protein LOC106411615 n=1 Tax=Brassica napus TaxID=3708 RepID=UPI002078D465|nr:uncharacterized protein LOC106411615 [Brassica napus]XP_048604362.1 uncharacterized protein LOC106411615 [Brassica napus]XP_048605960.1 uncharacterized protein LOC106411614 [Brassica napus]XP_048631732.1 uncharacterized protein LOC111201376 [Brassica napus]XP_048637723.1 uncharacterized protein LOC111201375 [Brassica napus]XP_048637724.1 uncharacterized protein LOC111201375 [Brassica napus]
MPLSAISSLAGGIIIPAEVCSLDRTKYLFLCGYALSQNEKNLASKDQITVYGFIIEHHVVPGNMIQLTSHYLSRPKSSGLRSDASMCFSQHDSAKLIGDIMLHHHFGEFRTNEVVKIM